MIQYVEGDATNPTHNGPAVIMHICNNVGAWGAGFVLAVSRRWPEPEDTYRRLFDAGAKNVYATVQLGQVQIVPVGGGVYVANMIAQRGVRSDSLSHPPIRYSALHSCLLEVGGFARGIRASIHCPRIGCGLAGGNWDTVRLLIEQTMPDLSVTVYDLPKVAK